MLDKLIILVKNNLEDSTVSKFKKNNEFKITPVSLDNFKEIINKKEYHPNVPVVIVMNKKLYFEKGDSIISVIHALGFKDKPTFLVIDKKFVNKEIDMIIEKNNNFLILPVKSAISLSGKIKKCINDNLISKRLNKYITDAFRQIVDTELLRKAQEKEKVLSEKIAEQKKIIDEMFRFTNKLNSLVTLNDIMDSIIETITRFIDSGRISIMLVDDSGKYLKIKKSVGIPADIVKKTKLKINEGIAGKVFSRGEVLIINDMAKEGLEKKYSDYDSFMSYPILCSPLAGLKVKLGVINITNKRDNLFFTESDGYIMSYISYSATIAINNRLNEIKLEDTFLGTIRAIARTIEAKDPYTSGHSDRVAKISAGIAEEMHLSKEKIKTIEIAGILHDVGKIGVPGEVLRKPDKLTKEEFDLIKEHPVRGEEILADIISFKKVRDIIRHHHERLDGTGYPDRLEGKDICLEAKIIAVADTFDAMNTDRPYRNRIPFNKILEEIHNVSGRQLDIKCIESLLKYLEKTDYMKDD